MKFYNRKSELELLDKIIRGSSTTVVIIKGFRRIGKTRLVLESLKNQEYIRIFVPKDKTTSSFLNDVSEMHNIPKFTSLKDLAEYIFEKYELVFFDEFQNFQYMEKSFFSELQDIIDRYKRGDRKLSLFITGSSYSLLKKIFYDYAKALYGRKDIEIPLYEFEVKTIMNILDDLNINNLEDKIKIWSVFGGIPKYYEILESLKINSFKEFIKLFYTKNFKSLLEEGKSILISELGGEYKTYYTVMEAIAFSKTKLSEIASLFNNDINAVNRYLDLLINDYNLVSKNLPLIGKGRLTKYKNNSNFFDFWFRFIRKYEDLYDINEFNNINEKFKIDFNKFLGKKFEDFIISLSKDILKGTFNYEKIGRQWGKIPNAPKNKNQYEIDIVGLNNKTKEILFGECKWKDKIDAVKIVKELAEKAEYVDWNKISEGNFKRRECFAVFAKSFKKKINEFEGRKVYCYDLGDVEKILNKRG